MLTRIALALLVSICAATAYGQAAAACPWLTSGTAERLLGGAVTVATNLHGNVEGSCSFTRQAGDNPATIEILIGPVDTHPCPRDSAQVRALGNLAVQCHSAISSSRESDRIAGHIRNVFFVVKMDGVAGATRREPSDPRLADSFGASPIELLAEVVVGNLY